MTAMPHDAAGSQDAPAAVGADGPSSVRLSLEVTVGSDPVRGRIGAAGLEREFVGWTELASAIEQCAHPGPSEAAQ